MEDADTTAQDAWNAALDAAADLAMQSCVGENSLAGSKAARKIADSIRGLRLTNAEPREETTYTGPCIGGSSRPKESPVQDGEPPSVAASIGDASQDTKRMDWLDAQKLVGIDHLGYGEYRYYAGEGFRGIRLVIDQAMQGEEWKLVNP
jgi:hypothetical protein